MQTAIIRPKQTAAMFGVSLSTVCNARIMELRRAGYQIACIMEQVENQYGQTVQRGRYSLVSEGRA